MGKGFFALLIGVVVGYQAIKPIQHFIYWAIIAGLTIHICALRGAFS